MQRNFLVHVLSIENLISIRQRSYRENSEVSIHRQNFKNFTISKAKFFFNKKGQHH